jgi:hypothetical protein
MRHTFYAPDPWVVAAALGIVMLAAWGLGYWFGQRFHRRDARKSTKIDDASLAILGLLLAFTFAMAMSKYAARREMMVSDSNAIGDFYTCTSLLPDPTRSSLQKVIQDYVRLRLEVARGSFDAARFERSLQEMVALQDRMAKLVEQAVYLKETPGSVATVLVQTLNGLTSSHAARLAAVKDRVPASILLLLFASALAAAIIIGREQGAGGDWHPATVAGFVLLICLVVWVTLDLSDPSRGVIRVSQDTMERLLRSMQGPTTAPAQ